MREQLKGFWKLLMTSDDEIVTKGTTGFGRNGMKVLGQGATQCPHRPVCTQHSHAADCCVLCMCCYRYSARILRLPIRTIMSRSRLCNTLR